MEYRLEMTVRALLEIEDVCEWMAQNSPQGAERWRVGLFQKLNTLKTLPERFAVAEEATAQGREVRELLYGKRHNVYRIFYIVEDDVVRVTSVRHGRRGSAG